MSVLFLDLSSSFSQSFVEDSRVRYNSNRYGDAVSAPPLPPRGAGRTAVPNEERTLTVGACHSSPAPSPRLPPALPIRRQSFAKRAQGSPDLVNDDAYPLSSSPVNTLLPPAVCLPPPPLHSRTTSSPHRLPPPLPPKSAPKTLDTADFDQRFDSSEI
jgi:hypothetical protein